MHHFVALPAIDSISAPTSPELIVAIKRWVREYLKLNEDAVVTVSEFACSDPGCPLLETVIAVFSPGESRMWKLTRPRVAVTKLMIQQTLASPPARRGKEAATPDTPPTARADQARPGSLR